MTDTLADEYPEGAEWIRQAVAEHGEQWVLDNYYQRLYPLGRLMAMPETEELPFFDPEEHDAMSSEEVTEMYRAWAAYRENLRTGTKPEE